jgi:hypothetical protein
MSAESAGTATKIYLNSRDGLPNGNDTGYMTFRLRGKTPQNIVGASLYIACTALSFQTSFPNIQSHTNTLVLTTGGVTSKFVITRGLYVYPFDNLIDQLNAFVANLTFSYTQYIGTADPTAMGKFQVRNTSGADVVLNSSNEACTIGRFLGLDQFTDVTVANGDTVTFSIPLVSGTMAIYIETPSMDTPCLDTRKRERSIAGGGMSSKTLSMVPLSTQSGRTTNPFITTEVSESFRVKMQSDPQNIQIQFTDDTKNQLWLDNAQYAMTFTIQTRADADDGLANIGGQNQDLSGYTPMQQYATSQLQGTTGGDLRGGGASKRGRY